MDEVSDMSQAYDYFINIFRPVLDQGLLDEVWFSNVTKEEVTPGTISDDLSSIESRDATHRMRSVHDMVDTCVLQAIELLDSTSISLSNRCNQEGDLESYYSGRSIHNDISRKKKNKSNKSSKQVFRLDELDTLDLLSLQRRNTKELESLSQLREVFVHDPSCRYPDRLLLETMRSFNYDLDKATNYLFSYEPCYISALMQGSHPVIPTNQSNGCYAAVVVQPLPSHSSSEPTQITEIQPAVASDSSGFITVDRSRRTEQARSSAADLCFQKNLLAHFSSTFKKNNPSALVSSSDNRLAFMGLRLDRPKQSGGNSFFNGGDYCQYKYPHVEECDVLIDLHGLNVQVALDIVHSSLSYYYSTFDDILKVDARLPMHNADMNSVFQHLRLRSKGRVIIIIRYIVGRGLHSPQGNGKLSGCVAKALQYSWQGVEYQRREGFVDVYLKK